MHPLPIMINYNIFCGSLALADSRVHMTSKAERLLRSLRLVLAREKSYNVSEAEGRSKHAKERTIKNRYLYVVFIWIFLINTQCFFTSFSIWNEVFFSLFLYLYYRVFSFCLNGLVALFSSRF